MAMMAMTTRSSIKVKPFDLQRVSKKLDLLPELFPDLANSFAWRIQRDNSLFRESINLNAGDFISA